MSSLGWDEARRLGHHWVGREHVLLGLARLDGVAGDVLREAGATAERLGVVLERLLRESDPPSEPLDVESPRYTPAVYTMRGRAEGFALTLGSGKVEPEHVLLSVLWPANGLPAGMLRALGIDRDELVHGLADRGVPVPAGKPELPDRRPRKRVDVPYEHLMAIVRELPKLLPEGSPFGVNHDGKGRAWIVVGDEVDVEALVSEVLARSK